MQTSWTGTPFSFRLEVGCFMSHDSLQVKIHVLIQVRGRMIHESGFLTHWGSAGFVREQPAVLRTCWSIFRETKAYLNY